MVEPSLLCEMYRPLLTKFLAVKATVDPDGLLGNEYLDKAFGLRV